MYIFVSLRFRVLRYEIFLKILNFKGFEFLRMRETEEETKSIAYVIVRVNRPIVNSQQ